MTYDRLRWALSICVLLGAWSSHGAERIVLADFEGADYGAWTVTGEAFGPGPAKGTLPRQNPVSGYLGQGLVNTYFQSDDTMGTLRSPECNITHPFLNLLVGGGNHVDKTCVKVLVNGEVIASLIGPANEALSWQSVDLTPHQDATLVIEIIDAAAGSWGHINVDHIELSDEARAFLPPRYRAGGSSRKLNITQPFLHLPVKNGAPKQRIRLYAEAILIDEFDIELAYSAPDFHTFVDLTPYLGKTLAIEADIDGDEAFVLEGLRLADSVPDSANLYRENNRPQFHFSPRRGWMNDPNGLVYYQGEYHLYFQHNPYGRQWGNMHWGHAVSRDLVHWQELPVAVSPRAYGDWAFSGSAIVDWKNRAGFQQGPEPALVIAYTSTGRGECIAFSNDRGRTFTEFPGNPVVQHDGRDPKLIWHEASGQWVMVVYEVLHEGTPEKDQTIAFYTSPDLKSWTHQSNISGYFECPELFELPVDGNPENRRWVLHAADAQYALGQFDGKTFVPEGDKIPVNYGNCFYASQTFNDIPDSDGRRIQIGWARHELGADMPFNQFMTFPTSLALQSTPLGIRLATEPVWELESLHSASHTWRDLNLEKATSPLDAPKGGLYHIEARILPAPDSVITLNIRGTELTYNATAQTLTVLDKVAPMPMEDGAIQLEILVDHSAIEIFGNLGRVYMPMGVNLPPDNESIALRTQEGTATVEVLVVHELQSAWR